MSRASFHAVPGYLLTSEVAEILHCTPKTVSRWAKEGKLPYTRTLGGHARFSEADIRALADQLHVQAAEERSTALLGDGHPRSQIDSDTRPTNQTKEARP